jgi:hypothetical protein
VLGPLHTVKQIKLTHNVRYFAPAEVTQAKRTALIKFIVIGAKKEMYQFSIGRAPGRSPTMAWAIATHMALKFLA